MHIEWTEVFKYVSLGFLEWDMLVGQTVINKKYGPGIIIAVDGRYFSVDFEDGKRRCFSFYMSLDYFAPLTPANQLAHRIQLLSLSRQAVKKTIDCTVAHPRLTDIDLELALTWSNHDYLVQDKENFDPIVLQEEHQQNEEIGRLLSARAAELTVMEFYRKNGFNVEDISIQQVLSPQSVEWKTHDLKINGYPVDVKNSRRSERNHDVYTEHCVPEFKQNRQGKEVAIVGVLSPFLSPCCIQNPQAALCSTSPIILGATQWRKLLGLKAFEKSGVFQIELRRLGSNASFLPPWVFEFGPVFYKERDEILAQARHIKVPMEIWGLRSAEILSSVGGANQSIVPILIASGVTVENYWNKELFQAWEWDFMNLDC